MRLAYTLCFFREKSQMRMAPGAVEVTFLGLARVISFFRDPILGMNRNVSEHQEVCILLSTHSPILVL